jgi:hypothetical protein
MRNLNPLKVGQLRGAHKLPPLGGVTLTFTPFNPANLGSLKTNISGVPVKSYCPTIKKKFQLPVEKN